MKPALIAHCRAGFEPEAAADLVAVADAAGTTLDIDAPRGRGYVVAHPAWWDARRWARGLEAIPPVFVRSLFFGSGAHALFDPAATKGRPDRVALLLPFIEAMRANASEPAMRTPAPDSTMRTSSSGPATPTELFVETADTNEGKELSGLGKAISEPLERELKARGWLAVEDGAENAARPRRAETSRLHVLFADGAHVYVGTSSSPWGSPWPMGIPRLKMPQGAPSRSALKLAEAFLVFLGDTATTLLRPAMHAVDLGAAPGGWTWQLAHRGLKVVAVDNGPLKGEVAADPLVTHLRTDGLSYRPRRPVDWLVCDIADQPARVASLVARWIAYGDARRAIFNLKLPMKKRWDEVERCRDIIAETLERAGIAHKLVLRQLYHDREEVTGYLANEHGTRPQKAPAPPRKTAQSPRPTGRTTGNRTRTRR